MTTKTFDFNTLIDGVSRTHNVRVVTLDGNPWFVGTDVLQVLHGKSAGMGHLYDPLAADQSRKVSRTLLGLPAGKPMVLVSESGLYKLIMRSDKPQALPFQDWVTREVLPSIRKTGSYELPKGEAMPLPASISAAFAEAMSGSIRHRVECDLVYISMA